jgi:hypothetical protein
MRMVRALLVWMVAPALFVPDAWSACCYFTAKDKDMLQPSQKVFITWDPATGTETFTVQPKFSGNAQDFGMVIPTPSQPKLHEMPRDFFKELAVYTIMGRREFPQSNLLWGGGFAGFGGGFGGFIGGQVTGNFQGNSAVMPPPPRKPAVTVVETGVVGSLDYKIIKADRADDLFRWLKDHRYRYAGDEAILQHYIGRKWYFTVMKIDTLQMKRNKDGTFDGEVTPTRFQFYSDKCVYPLKITQLSVKDKTEALFYVQAPTKMDLAGDMSYQLNWLPLLQAARGCSSGALPGEGDRWLKAVKDELPALEKRNQALGFDFVSGARPQANALGRTPTTLEWAKKLGAADIFMLQGRALYAETVPDPDFGFSRRDLQNPQRAAAVRKVIQQRLAQYQKLRPRGFFVREAPAEDIRNLRLLLGHLEAGAYITKFRKLFCRDEMNDDLVLMPARVGQTDDMSEYWEMLPTSPP